MRGREEGHAARIHAPAPTPVHFVAAGGAADVKWFEENLLKAFEGKARSRSPAASSGGWKVGTSGTDATADSWLALAWSPALAH